MPDAYSGQSIYSVLQGIQLELQSGRTRSDRPFSVFAKSNQITFYVTMELLHALA